MVVVAVVVAVVAVLVVVVVVVVVVIIVIVVVVVVPEVVMVVAVAVVVIGSSSRGPSTSGSPHTAYRCLTFEHYLEKSASHPAASARGCFKSSAEFQLRRLCRFFSSAGCDTFFCFKIFFCVWKTNLHATE